MLLSLLREEKEEGRGDVGLAAGKFGWSGLELGFVHCSLVNRSVCKPAMGVVPAGTTIQTASLGQLSIHDKRQGGSKCSPDGQPASPFEPTGLLP